MISGFVCALTKIFSEQCKQGAGRQAGCFDCGIAEGCHQCRPGNPEQWRWSLWVPPYTISVCLVRRLHYLHRLCHSRLSAARRRFPSIPSCVHAGMLIPALSPSRGVSPCSAQRADARLSSRIKAEQLLFTAPYLAPNLYRPPSVPHSGREPPPPPPSAPPTPPPPPAAQTTTPSSGRRWARLPRREHPAPSPVCARAKGNAGPFFHVHTCAHTSTTMIDASHRCFGGGGARAGGRRSAAASTAMLMAGHRQLGVQSPSVRRSLGSDRPGATRCRAPATSRALRRRRARAVAEFRIFQRNAVQYTAGLTGCAAALGYLAVQYHVVRCVISCCA